jgi:hypothetical protein
MTPIRILGIVLLVVGILLLFFGWQASETFLEEVHEGLTGRYTQETMWYFIGGAAATVAGLLMLLFGRARH